MEEFRKEATELCIKNGAKADSIETIPDEVPLSYLPGLAIRIIMKAIGDLDLTHIAALEDDHKVINNAEEFIVEDQVEPFIEKKSN